MTFMYADDTCLAAPGNSVTEIERKLNRDLQIITAYYKDWGLLPNPSKSESLLCTLNTREADTRLNINFNGQPLPHNDHPKYLGVYLDRTLTYHHHLQTQGKKLGSRVNLIHKLAGTQWGASADTLRISTLSLVYSPAEYCASTWESSAHTRFVDVQLNSALRIISGTVKSTPLAWLPVLANIEPSVVRRNVLTSRLINKTISNEDSLLSEFLQQPPPKRLRSRRYIWDRIPAASGIDGPTQWKQFWLEHKPNINHELITDPNIKINGFDLPRNQWTKLNRLRTGHGRCNHLMHKWGYRSDPSCDCGEPNQTMLHISNHCPFRSFPGGIQELHQTTPRAISWLNDLDLII